MNYALLVSNLQGVCHVKHVFQAPITLVKPTLATSSFKRMVTRLAGRLQHR
jgi:hypothetical protein